MLGIDRSAARITWTVIAVAGSLYLLFLTRKILFVFVVALFLSLLIAPLVQRLQRYGKGRLSPIVAVSIAFLVSLIVVVAVVALLGPTISAQGSDLVERLPALVASVNSMTEVPLPAVLEPWRDRVGGIVKELLANATASALPFAKTVVGSVLGVASELVYLIIIPILAFLFLKDGPILSQVELRWVPLAKRQRMMQIVTDIHEVLGQYVRSLGLLSLAIFVVYGAFFFIVGVPFGFLLATLAALLEFIPLIGPLTAAGLVLVVALIAGYQNLLWLAVFLVVYRIFQDYVLSPRLMSDGVGLPPVLIIFGFLAGEQLAGIPGMFLAVPILAVLRIILTSADAHAHIGPRPPV